MHKNVSLFAFSLMWTSQWSHDYVVQQLAPIRLTFLGDFATRLAYGNLHALYQSVMVP